jgi:hypothetical protein
VPGERLHVVPAELLEQPRRALDVREEKGDGPGGELAHAHHDATGSLAAFRAQAPVAVLEVLEDVRQQLE